MSTSSDLSWYEIPGGQTYIGDAEIIWMSVGGATGTHYCKSRDGGVWSWNKALRKWIPVAA